LWIYSSSDLPSVVAFFGAFFLHGRSYRPTDTEKSAKQIIQTTSTEQAFFISSLQTDAKHCSQLVRGHWSVENQLHWMLDVAFHEDECAVHTGNAPQNLSLLRKIALACIKKDTSVKASVARKRKIAGWDNKPPRKSHCMFKINDATNE
jgi:predicted transposase YbfD/YdcC